KLLRVLESREIRRVGDNQSSRVDVRVICATHRDLEEMVAAGEFREDLMFRINTFEIYIPPLRERHEDIPELARHLYQRFRSGRPSETTIFTAETLELLRTHTWPGNVRELANVIEHATIVCDTAPIRPEHLPQSFTNRRLRGLRERPAQRLTLAEHERQVIVEVMERHGGNRAAAAQELGISIRTLFNKMIQIHGESWEKSA
ncbi:MAG: sigma 54-interacting transcriptional regulator, partial [Planctomycetota bacterium]